MNSGRFNKLLDRTAKIGLCVSAGGYALFGSAVTPEVTGTPVPAITAAGDSLYDAFGRVKCEDGAAVTKVFVESIPTSGVAKIKRVGKTSVESFNKGTDDPLFTVHVYCKGLDQVDKSLLTFADKEDDFLCYTKPNPDDLLIDRCEADPALAKYR
jgi:hypothetical protein